MPMRINGMNETSPTPARTPEGIVNLADYERLAERHLDPNAWAYISGGAGDEITLRWNREVFDQAALSSRVLRGSKGPDTRVELLGQVFAHPILVAPVAYQQLAHPQGERATAMAAAAQEAGLVLSTLSSVELEDVAKAAGPRRWFQLYLQRERTYTLDLVRRAEGAGYEALVVTVDAPINGLRNREHRVRFQLPPGVAAANLSRYPSETPPADMRPVEFFMAGAPTWSDIAWLAGNTRLPILLKGILAGEDAHLAFEHGARGVIVSNHGGRTFDTAPATFSVLAEIVDRVAGRGPVLIDGGIRRGTDVLKCIARGASAVLVGRPIAYGLAVAGALGVSHVLRLLRDELEIAMALTGCASLAEAGPGLLRLSR
jgi:4-hydroxymandelate oxidase